MKGLRLWGQGYPSVRMSVLRVLLLSFTIAVVLAVVADCERSFGVSRSARLSKFPDPACVRTVLQQVSGIRDYDESFWPEREGERAPDGGRSHNFAYNSDHLTIALGLFDDRPGSIRFVQSYLFGRRVSQSEADEARRLMIAVEAALVTKCGLTELKEGVSEYCAGVKCR